MTLQFPDFKTIPVSTRTFIVAVNLTLDIDALFKTLPVTPYTVVHRRRGRRKKEELASEQPFPGDGSILALEYQGALRGADFRKRRRANGNYFRNSVTVVMAMNGKKINFKISRNGKIQMTGCKTYEQAQQCTQHVWEYIKDTAGIYTFSRDIGVFHAIVIPVMRNIDFSLNFNVDREKLDGYFNANTDFNSLLETSFGYTGINIKMPVEKPLTDLNLRHMRYEEGKWSPIGTLSYSSYLATLPAKDASKTLKKARYNTFLVFHSGKVIMSGMEASFMEGAYQKFTEIIQSCHHMIRETLIK